MEGVLAQYAQIYGIAAICLLILILVVMNVNTYETLVIRNLFRSLFIVKKEGFQSGDIVSGGAVHPDKINRDTCASLKEQIKNYEQVKVLHKDVPIANLNETLAQMKEYFVSFNCE